MNIHVSAAITESVLRIEKRSTSVALVTVEATILTSPDDDQELDSFHKDVVTKASTGNLYLNELGNCDILYNESHSLQLYPSSYLPPAVDINSCVDVLEMEGTQLEVLRVPIDHLSYNYASLASFGLWTKDKSTGVYNDGMLNTKLDPRRTERTGLLGEIAFARVFGLKVDFQYQKKGKKVDFYLQNLQGNYFSIDVKTSNAIQRERTQSLVSVEGKNGGRKEMHCGVYIASFLDVDIPQKQYAEVVLVGWKTKKDLEDQVDVPSHVYGGKNKELNFTELHSIIDLYKMHEKVIHG